MSAKAAQPDEDENRGGCGSRPRDVFEILDELGIERKDFWKLVEAGTIERIVLRKGGRGYYLRAAVELHLVQPFRAAEERLAGRC